MRLGSIFIVLMLVGKMQAQFFFNSISVKDGLAQSSVNFVVADKQGYYWIGTQFGLSRFNGKEFENFSTATHSGISDNFFLSAITDTIGNLWFATRNGICRYLLNEKRFQTIVLPPSTSSLKGYNPIWSLTKGPAGDLLFIAGSICYQVSAQECVKNRPNIRPLFKTDQRYQYVASSNSQLLLVQKDSIVLYKWQHQILGARASFAHTPSHRSVPYVIRSFNNNFYLINRNQLYKVSDAGLQLLNTPYISADISDVLQYKGRILIATYQGLFETDLNFNLKKHYAHTKENSFSLSENKLLSISKTSDGCIWIGTANSGINLHRPITEQFTVLSKVEGQRYLSFCVKQINPTTIFAGTENGIDKFEYISGKWNYIETNFYNYKVTCLQNYKDLYFIGTTQGLFYENNKSFKRIAALSASAQIFDLQLNEKLERLIVSSTEGLTVIDLKTLTLIKMINRKSRSSKNKELIGTNYVFSTNALNDSTMVVNTTTGAYEIDSGFNASRNLFATYPYKSLNEIMIVKSVPINTTLFCGSLGNGLYCIRNGTTSVITNAQGLSNNVVASLEKDTEDNVWISTNNGINCYTKNGRLFSLTEELPLSSVEFISNASATFHSYVWFCSNSGVIGFQPKTLVNHSAYSELKLQLELISKNYTDTLTADSVLEFSTADKNINFRFCAPGINTFNKTQITFRLNGFDTAWRAAGNNKNINFSNLQSGIYNLEVIASLQGTDTVVKKTYTLKVIPPFYQRTWFVITTCVFGIFSTILLVYYFSRLRLKRKLILLQAEQKVLEEKQRISEELHDNIGSQISTLISGLDKMQLKGNVSQAEHLSDFARGTLHELRETIWALHLGAVSANEIRSKIENHVFELRSNYENICFETSYVISTNIVFEPEKALSIFRIFQEALSNALKHSAANKMNIQLCATEHIFSIVVTDNGKGFDTGLRKSGHYGLNNMIARAAKYGISFEIKSEINKGTQISILLNHHD